MPTIAQWQNRAIAEILAATHMITYDSRLFDAAAHIALDANNERLMYPGMIVAISTATNNYVPYSALAAYGPGSDTPVGILWNFKNATLGDKAIEPVVHARVFEHRCYLYTGVVGVIPQAVKNALPQIVWV